MTHRGIDVPGMTLVRLNGACFEAAIREVGTAPDHGRGIVGSISLQPSDCYFEQYFWPQAGADLI